MTIKKISLALIMTIVIVLSLGMAGTVFADSPSGRAILDPLPMSYIDIPYSSVSISRGQGKVLTANILSNDTTAYVTWTSSNTNVAKVTTDGYVVGVGTGTTVLTATYQGRLTEPGKTTDTCTITVSSSGIIGDDYYLLYNYQRKNFLSMASNASSATLQDLTVDDRSQWYIHLNSSGYYTICSEMTGKYLAMDEDGYIWFTTSSTSQDAMWSLHVTSKGYALISRSGENEMLTIVINDYGLISVCPYVSDGNNDDEWTLFSVEAIRPVNYESQERTKWCWVTAARMYISNYYPTITRTQSQAVAYVKGSAINAGGSLAEASAAMNYYSYDGHYGEYYRNNLVYDADVLCDFLDDGHVVYISRGEYEGLYDRNSRESGHATLLIGYVNDGAESWFIIADPWDASRPYSLMSYDKLYNSLNHKPNESIELDEDNNVVLRVWDGFIVYNTSYCTYTSPYYYDTI